MIDTASLLLHSADVPALAKAELLAARSGPASERDAHLRSAALALMGAAPLACDEARELVGLPAGQC